MACPNVTDLLRAKAESLGEKLYQRASFKSPILGAIPRADYGLGEGYEKSTFTIGRSEPASDEETWVAIAAVNSDNGPCAVTYNAVTNGHKENKFKPSSFGLKGPVRCVQEFEMNWKSQDFWTAYMGALEKRSKRSIENKLLNTYMQYSYKASANSTITWYAGDITTQPFTGTVTTTDLDGANIPLSMLTQDMLDQTALVLNEEGADAGDTNGWVTLGNDGPIYPLLIGQEASFNILMNNSEVRADYNASYQGAGEVNPVIKRMGANRVIKNFRHLINPFPPRWKVDGGLLVRVPTWVMSTDAANATKGSVAVINSDWRDASVAAYEAAVVLNPLVMTEEVLRPAGLSEFGPQNYYGEWAFVTGNDAVLGMDSCQGLQDPLHRYGRHFAEYRHACKPIFPEFGRVILFKRCAGVVDTVTCS